MQIIKTTLTSKSNLLDLETCQVLQKIDPIFFWEAAQMYERKNARTAASLVIALPKELTLDNELN